jgi:hypothetical protein
MSDEDDDGPARRSRGRPRTDIDVDAVAEAVTLLLSDGGLSAVSIGCAAQHLERDHVPQCVNATCW